ncbi:hypothetical protein SO694_00030244 [Aureococcus anophagefferens]|uniref:LamG-like jellyroll fold domain-containing protein n=1 Tax=Aureococcus anophagefferens TaxID=44056 RepID=A0ABR1FJY1_AURAN
MYGFEWAPTRVDKLTGAIGELYVYSALDREATRLAVLPDALTYEALTGDEERTICLWARIDDWDGGFLFEYGSDSGRRSVAPSGSLLETLRNVTLALSGSYQTVVTIYGNTSYIDWDDWHHYCLTYDGATSCSTSRPRRGDARRLDTETMYGLRVGADMYESNKLTGAIDELYVYTSALDREAISVLYGSGRVPAVTPAPSTYYFEGTLRAYYSFDEGNATDATGAYSGDTR